MRITATLGAANMPAGVILHPREQLRQMRSQIAAAAQRLIDILDWIDGDPDMEPELAQTTGSLHFEDQEVTWCLPAIEGDGEPDLENTGDGEPSLGSVNAMHQGYWAQGGTDELEEQCDDEGIDTDSEPDEIADSGWCGSAPFAMDQTGAQWAHGEGCDRPRPPEPPTRIEQRPLGLIRGPNGNSYQATALVTVPAAAE